MNLITTLVFAILFKLVISNDCQNNFTDISLPREERTYFQNKTNYKYGKPPKANKCPLPKDHNFDRPMPYENLLFGRKLTSAACISKHYSNENIARTFVCIENDNIDRTANKEGKTCDSRYSSICKACGSPKPYASVFTTIEDYTIREIYETTTMAIPRLRYISLLSHNPLSMKICIIFLLRIFICYAAPFICSLRMLS